MITESLYRLRSEGAGLLWGCQVPQCGQVCRLSSLFSLASSGFRGHM